MPTRNVVLTDSQAKFVEQMVASGHYQNASEVLCELKGSDPFNALGSAAPLKAAVAICAQEAGGVLTTCNTNN